MPGSDYPWTVVTRGGPLHPDQQLPRPGDRELARDVWFNAEQDTLSIKVGDADVTIHPARQLFAVLGSAPPEPAAEELLIEPCPGCGQAIRWFRLEEMLLDLHWFPVDPEPSLSGTIVPTAARTARLVTPKDPPATRAFAPHQVRCQYMRDADRRKAGPRGR